MLTVGISLSLPASHLADFDVDRDVDEADLSTFAEEYGREYCLTGDLCASDCYPDERVDEIDLLFLSEDYGRVDCRIEPGH